MTEQIDCKEFSSKGIAASELLSPKSCELCEVVATAGGNTGFVRIYNGENANGELKMTIKVFSNQSRQIGFHHHVYLRRGLYIEFVENIDFCFVQWKVRPSNEG